MPNPLISAIRAWERHCVSLEEIQFRLTGDRARHDPEADTIIDFVWEAARSVQGMPERARVPYLNKLWSGFEKEYREQVKGSGRFEGFKLRKQIEELEQEMTTPEWRQAKRKQLERLRIQVDKKLEEYKDA